MSVKFSIGQVSKLFEVSIDTLRYYDKVGLLKPIINKENGYRYYGLSELDQLGLILNARSLEIPVKDIIRTIKSEEINSYINLIEDQERLINERINILTNLQKDINENKKVLEEIKEHKNIVSFETIKPYEAEYNFIVINTSELLTKGDYKKYLRLLDHDISKEEYFYSYSITVNDEIVENMYNLYIKINDYNEKFLQEMIESNKLVIETIKISGKFIKVKYYGDKDSINKYIKDLNNKLSGKENNYIFQKDYFYLPGEKKSKYYCEIILKI